jgi:hypothetical protein
MDNKVHLTKTLGPVNELLEHFDIAIYSLVKVHAGKDFVRIVDGILNELLRNWTHKLSACCIS